MSTAVTEEPSQRRVWGLVLACALLLSGSAATAQEEDSAQPVGSTMETESSRPGVIRLGPRDGEGETGEMEGEPSGEDPTDVEVEATGEEPGDTEIVEEIPIDEREDEDTGPPIIRPERLVGDPEEELPRYFEDEFNPFDPPSSLRVQIDFPDAELTDVVMWMSALTGQNFIIADNVHSGKRITIIGPTPVTIGEAYAAFMAALHMNGLTVVPYGSFLRIVPEEGIQRHALPFTPSGRVPGDDRMVTQIIPLDYVDAQQMSETLEPMKTSNGVIQLYAPTNTLIITETGTNLTRMLELIAMLDTPGGENRFIYQVRYADAEELRNVLLEVFQQQEQQQAREEPRSRRRRRRDRDEEASSERDTEGAVTVSQIVADSRTNQLIIVSSPRSYEAIREMAEALDVPIAGEGQIHVLFLENANATELAGTLQGLTQSVEQAREEEGRGRRQERDEEAAPTGPATVSATFTGDVSITADEPTNSLVVVASLRDFLNLQRVVEQLDRRREQVYVEAVIMEVNVNNEGQMGMAFNAGAVLDIAGEEVPLIFGTSLGTLNSLVLDPTALQGLAAALRGPELEGTEGLLFPGIGIPSFGAILQALQTDTSTNIMATPHILTTDNEEAEIIVGETIPYIVGGTIGAGSAFANIPGSDLAESVTATSLGSLGLPTFNVQREQVSLTLRIKPQINESNFVRLEIEEEVEQVIAMDELRGPTTANREARTVVVVEDQQTVVIGGLLQDEVTETVEKVPFFGDIPILGYLFRRTTNTVRKRNLLLLLTPYIIRDSSDFHEIFRRKMRERQEFLEFFGREEFDYVASVDYSRKNGPLESMFLTLQSAIENEEARARAQGLFDSPQLSPTIQSAPIGGDETEEE